MPSVLNWLANQDVSIHNNDLDFFFTVLRVCEGVSVQVCHCVSHDRARMCVCVCVCICQCACVCVRLHIIHMTALALIFAESIVGLHRLDHVPHEDRQLAEIRPRQASCCCVGRGVGKQGSHGL